MRADGVTESSVQALRRAGARQCGLVPSPVRSAYRCDGEGTTVTQIDTAAAAAPGRD